MEGVPGLTMSPVTVTLFDNFATNEVGEGTGMTGLAGTSLPRLCE